MKNFTFIPAILLSLASVNALADSYICQPITGTIQPLTIDAACGILQEKAAHFPDLTFYGAYGTCFSGILNAKLGSTEITGKSYSGLTANGLGQLTGASAIRLYSGSNELGRVFTKDVIFNAGGAVTEMLTVVGGRKMFNEGYGSIEITGDTSQYPSSFTGQLCTEN